MTTHSIVLNPKGIRTRVVLGWDRPLQGYFMNIFQMSISGPEAAVYSSLEDERTQNGYADNLDVFTARLAALEIEVPRHVLESVYLDQLFNVGNRSKDHSSYVRLTGPFKGVSGPADGLLELPTPAGGVPLDLVLVDGEGVRLGAIPLDESPSQDRIGEVLAEACAHDGDRRNALRGLTHVFVGDHWLASADLP